MSTSQPRQLSKEGQQIFYKARVGVTTLLSVIYIFYAAFRAQHVATQFPVTFQTTIAPRKLPFNLFNLILPAPTFEFPPVSLCGVKSINCSLVSNILSEQCNFTQVDTCAVFQPTPMAGANDILAVVPVLLSASSFASITWNDTYIPIVQNTTTSVIIKKIVMISLKNAVTTDYELHFYSVPTPGQTLAQFKYKNFQITYEKSFYPLDMNNWFGEIGGVAALFFFLHMAVMTITMSSLKRNSRYSDSLYAKAANENFDQFN